MRLGQFFYCCFESQKLTVTVLLPVRYGNFLDSFSPCISVKKKEKNLSR